MRIRTIKPEFYLHAELFTAEKELGYPLRVAYSGLWCAADREGRFKWRPMALGVTILPYDGIEFSRVLDALMTRGFIVKYRVGVEWYGAIPSFPKHQVINNRERKSEIPDISTAEEVAQVDSTRDARVTHASKEEGKGREWNREQGTEGKGVQGETKKRRKPSETTTDDAWLSDLKMNPAYASVDIQKELGKATAWCGLKHRQCTRRFFLGWLNRAEQAMSSLGAPSKGVNHTLINAENWEKQEEHAAKVRAERERTAKVSAELDRKMKELEEMP